MHIKYLLVYRIPPFFSNMYIIIFDAKHTHSDL